MCFLGRENYEMALHIPGGVKWSSWTDPEADTSSSQVLVTSDGSSPQDIEIEFGNTADDSETQFSQSSTSLYKSPNHQPHRHRHRHRHSHKAQQSALSVTHILLTPRHHGHFPLSPLPLPQHGHSPLNRHTALSHHSGLVAAAMAQPQRKRNATHLRSEYDICGPFPTRVAPPANWRSCARTLEHVNVLFVHHAFHFFSGIRIFLRWVGEVAEPKGRWAVSLSLSLSLPLPPSLTPSLSLSLFLSTKASNMSPNILNAI